jgi:hypothetical protein
LTVSKISTAKPAAIVPSAAIFHHANSDSIGPVAASAIIPSRRRYWIAQTFGPFSQMVKLHLGTIVYYAARQLCCFSDTIRSRRPASVKCIGCASHFEIVIGIPTFSIRPMVVWNKMLRIRKLLRSHSVSFTE